MGEEGASASELIGLREACDTMVLPCSASLARRQKGGALPGCGAMSGLGPHCTPHIDHSEGTLVPAECCAKLVMAKLGFD